MNFLQQIGQRLKAPVFSGYGGRGGWGWLNGFPGGGTFDYKREAGPLWESSIPFMCLNWERRAVVEAQAQIQVCGADGKWKNAPSHAMLELLRTPNPSPMWDMHRLMDAVRFDFHLTGNGYLYKNRSASGRVISLDWIPSYMIEPRWEENGESFIDCYQYLANGVSYAIPVEDIIHFAQGIDPRSQGRKGLSPFHALLREVCTDNEASIFSATLLRNMGIPGVIVSPKGTAENPTNLTKSQRAEFKEMWKESFTGENRGEPFVQGIPVDVQMPGFNPQQMAIDAVRAIPEQRLSGAFGIPASVLQLGTGLENSNTKAGKSDDREQAYESCVIPTLIQLARTLTHSLLTEFGDVIHERVWFDLSDVKCLQEDKLALWEALGKAAGGKPIFTQNEAREAAGYPKVTEPGADVLGAATASTSKPDDSDPDEPKDKTDDTKDTTNGK